MYCSWSKYQIKTKPSTKYLMIVFILWNGYVSSKIQRVFCTIWIFASMVSVRTLLFIWECPNPEFFPRLYIRVLCTEEPRRAHDFWYECVKSPIAFTFVKSKTKPYCNFIFFSSFSILIFTDLKQKKALRACVPFFVFI